MKKRSPVAVLLLPCITFSIYPLYWLVKTKGEMNKLGEKIPTALIWFIPIVGQVWWLWKYSEGVEHVTCEKLNAPVVFLLCFLLGPIGQAIVQDSFNKTAIIGETSNINNMNLKNDDLAQPAMNNNDMSSGNQATSPNTVSSTPETNTLAENDTQTSDFSNETVQNSQADNTSMFQTPIEQNGVANQTKSEDDNLSKTDKISNTNDFSINSESDSKDS